VSEGEHRPALQLLCGRELGLNRMTLKLEDDPDILKIYAHTENEAASLRHSNLRALIKKYEICLVVKGQNVKSSDLSSSLRALS